ncbi:MAG: helix-turn-helix transcriptional regulator [Jatrophihabitantaceae bacterium]
MSELLTPLEVGARLKRPIETLRYWRGIGYGPKWIKTGRLVRYPADALEQWIDAQSCSGDAA